MKNELDLNTTGSSKRGYFAKKIDVTHLSSSQSAQPPAFDAAGVLFQHCEDVAASKRQLVRRLGDVVVQRPRHAVLQHTERNQLRKLLYHAQTGSKIRCQLLRTSIDTLLYVSCQRHEYIYFIYGYRTKLMLNYVHACSLLKLHTRFGILFQ